LPLAFVSAIRIGRAENQNADTEALWILETLERDGIPAGDVDLLLTGANGLTEPDNFYRARRRRIITGGRTKYRVRRLQARVRRTSFRVSFWFSCSGRPGAR